MTHKDEPGGEPIQIARPDAQGVQRVVEMLTAEPNSGVGVGQVDGRWVYMNDQLARLLFGPSARAADYVNRSWYEILPRYWADERVAILRQMVIDKRPVLLRTLWRDCQLHTWMTLIDQEGDSEVPEFAPTEPLYLSITRVVSAEADLGPVSDAYRKVDSEVIRLDQLGSLSNRELEVLALLGQGLSVKEAARVLFRAEKTIERHRDAIHQKLSISDRSELVKIALRAGLRLTDVDRSRV